MLDICKYNLKFHCEMLNKINTTENKCLFLNLEPCVKGLYTDKA